MNITDYKQHLSNSAIHPTITIASIVFYALILA